MIPPRAKASSRSLFSATWPWLAQPRNGVRLVVLASYGALSAALVHWLTDTWSGAASLGIAFAVFIGAPVAFVYAGYLCWKYPLQSSVRVEVAACAALPVSIMLLWALATHLGRTQSP